LIGVLSEANYRFVEVPLRRKGALIAANMVAEEKQPTGGAEIKQV
jgi:peptidoglycan/LPS O-acetylase OafA/YrhL